MENSTVNAKGLLYLGEYSEEYDQLIFASQSYGTFYTIYAKIKTSAIGKGERKIDEIKLKIQNYKGILDLGLEKAEYNDATGQIDLFVKALGNTKEEITCENLSNLDIKNGADIVFLRHLQFLPKENNDGIYEIEGYYRDGDHQPRRPNYNKGDEKESAAPGVRCMMSELKILI